MQKPIHFHLSFLLSILGMLTAYGSAIANEVTTGQKATPPSEAGLEANSSPRLTGVSNSSLLLPSSSKRPAAAVNAQASEPAEPTVKIVAPQNLITRERKTTLVVEYPAGSKIQVWLNQKPLDPTTPTQIQNSPDGNLTTQVWYNIPLKVGENQLTVKAAGNQPVSTTVKVQETAYQIRLRPSGSPQVPADGRSAIALEGQILDEKDQPIVGDAIVTLTTSAGKFLGVDQDPDRAGFQVIARQGFFAAQLQTNVAPQKVRVRAAVDQVQNPDTDGTGYSQLFPLQNPVNSTPKPEQNTVLWTPLYFPLETYTQVEFIPALRPFIISGAVNLTVGPSGVNFYDSFRDFLNPDILGDGTRADVDLALFATGSIGEWLFTAALNNQRSLNQDCTGANRLFRADQFCDQTYPVYGDSSSVDFLTPSLDSVFVRIERTSPVPGAGTDFAMWGDYRTQEFTRASQFYTAINRPLHGFKINYNLGDLQFTGIYGERLQGFQRDSIAPNGTSGYYYLARRYVLGGSEAIFIETAEISNPSNVISRRQLTRALDYEIDYDRGAILLRQPIFPVEVDLFGRSLVRRIVVTYQYDGTDSGDAYLFGGRLQYNFSREVEHESWAGFTYLKQNLGDNQYELYGADVFVGLGKDARITAEFARSNSDSIFFGEQGGNAYRVEAVGNLLPGLSGRAYYNSVEADFVNDSTVSFTPGQTNYGVELAGKVTPSTQINFLYNYQENFGIAPAVRGLTSVTPFGLGTEFGPTSEFIPGNRVNNNLTTIAGSITQKIGRAELGLGLVSRSGNDDTFADTLNQSSLQLVSRFSYALLDNLTFRAQDERNLSQDAYPLYPTRTTLALDWAVYPGVIMRVAQQFIEPNSEFQTNSITSLETLMDYRLSEDTSLTGRYTVLNGVNGWTGASTLGIKHAIRLAPGLKLSLGFERIASNIFLDTQSGQQFPQAVAVGQSAASLGITEGTNYNIGLEYTDNPNFKASFRFDYRDAEEGDNMVVSATAAGKLSPSLTALFRYQQASVANQLLTDIGLGDTINLKLGLAYRNPNDDKFNALLRYEYRQNPFTIPQSALFGSGNDSNIHLITLEALYTPNWRWEFYGKFGLRSTTSYLASDLSGTNAVTLGQFRAIYRLNNRFDIGGQVRWIGQSVTDYSELGYVAELGYYLTPDLRFGVGYTFGRADRDFGDRSNGGFFFALTYKVNQLLSGFGWRNVTPPQQQESKEQPVAAQPTVGGESR